MKLWWQGSSTTTTARICVRSDVDGDVVGVGGGQTQTATAAIATNDGVVMLEFTGLSADAEYNIALTVAGTAYTTGKIRTAPTTNVIMAFSSCMHQDFSGVPLLTAIKRHNIDSFLMLGDQGYFDDPRATYNGGLTCVDISTDLANLGGATGLANRYCHYKHYLLDAGIKRITQAVNYFQTWDDHQVLNEWEPAPERLDTELSLAPGTADAADVTDCLAQSTTAYEAYAQGNPDTSVIYYSFIRVAEFFVLDCLSNKTTYTNTSTDYPAAAGDRTMLGATQLAWLKTQLAASTKTFKVIVSSKKIIGDTDSINPDDWQEYPVESADILGYIDDSVNGGNPDSWAVPGGVLWLGGDRHNIQLDAAATNTMASICPIGSGSHASGSAVSTVVYRATGQGNYGLLDINSNRMIVSACNSKGEKVSALTIVPGSNVSTSYPEQVGI